MKWVFFTVATLLLVVSLAGLTGMGRSPAASQSPGHEPATEPTLRLLREIPPAAVKPEKTAVVESLPVAPEPETTREVPPAGTDALIESEQEGPPEPQDESLVVTGATELEGPQTVATQRSGRCYRVGPFTGALDARLAASLPAAVQVLDVHTAIEAENRGFWVLEPPYPSRDQAIQRVRALRAQDIDSFVLTDGALENAVSLGLFQEERAAGLAQRRFEARDIRVDVVPRTRHVERHWLTLAVDDAEVSVQELREALEPDDGPMVAESVGCPELPSPRTSA